VAFTQWMGVPLLRKFRSNLMAMSAALSVGVASGVILGLAAFGGSWDSWKTISLWVFLFGVLLMSVATGVQCMIETNWIGDLVPLEKRGWFVSVKSVVTLLGMTLLGLFFGWAVDNNPDLPVTSLWIYSLVAVSHVAAILLIKTIPDREPQCANFFKSGVDKDERIDYFSKALWSYLGFCILWGSGRSLLFAFITIFLIDNFKMGLLQLSSLNIINYIVSIGFLLFMGKISDQKGNRILLIIISIVVGSSMFLWVATPWVGLIGIVVFYFINSAAGTTHSMLINNYALEIFPIKGRASYISITRFISGAFTLLAVTSSGFLMRKLQLSEWSFTLWGEQMTRYHLIFFIGAIIAISSFIPLLLYRKPRQTAITQ
ncbi:MAG: MFS transporter, partial [Victivallaceae bacterium]